MGLQYEYAPFGHLAKVIDALGNQTLVDTDAYGRRRTLDDPDTGHHQFGYNSFGEQVFERDSRGLETRQDRDALGRVTKRTDKWPGSGPLETTTWTWDTAALGGSGSAVGLLAATSSPDGITQSFTYDSLARPTETSWSMPEGRFTTTTSYDSKGRPLAVTFPGPTVAGHGYRYAYDVHGHLIKVEGQQLSGTPLTYWEALADNPAGQITRERLGSGYTTTRLFDPVTQRATSIGTSIGTGDEAFIAQSLSYTWDLNGNLASRAAPGRYEEFGYDVLDRLTASCLDGCGTGGGATVTMTYDAIGNVRTKSDVGTYGYADPGQSKPHAVQSILGARPAQFHYDAAGNVDQRPDSTVVYTPFNKPRTVTLTQRSNATVSYGYDAAMTRVRKVSPDEQVVYIGGAYERHTRGGIVEHRYHISAAGRNVAQVTWKHLVGSSGLSEEIQFLHADHLGSTDTRTAPGGQLLESVSFDPWGHPRDASDWNGQIAWSIWDDAQYATGRGFTGHEMEPELDLVHMGGRIYDPVIGRFLQPDPFVQAPLNGQTLNRYSYTFNRYSYVGSNPLSLVDPSGYMMASPGGPMLQMNLNVPLAFAQSVVVTEGASFCADATACKEANQKLSEKAHKELASKLPREGYTPISDGKGFIVWVHRGRLQGSRSISIGRPSIYTGRMASVAAAKKKLGEHFWKKSQERDREFGGFVYSVGPSEAAAVHAIGIQGERGGISPASSNLLFHMVNSLGVTFRFGWHTHGADRGSPSDEYFSGRDLNGRFPGGDIGFAQQISSRIGSLLPEVLYTARGEIYVLDDPFSPGPEYVVDGVSGLFRGTHLGRVDLAAELEAVYAGF